MFKRTIQLEGSTPEAVLDSAADVGMENVAAKWANVNDFTAAVEQHFQEACT